MNHTSLLSPCVTLGESVVSLGLSFLCIKHGDIAGFLGNTESETSVLPWHITATREFFPAPVQGSPGRRVSQNSPAQMSKHYMVSVFPLKLSIRNLKTSVKILLQLRFRTDLLIFHLDKIIDLQPRGVGFSERIHGKC